MDKNKNTLDLLTGALEHIIIKIIKKRHYNRKN
jgi:hypothetical protein